MFIIVGSSYFTIWDVFGNLLYILKAQYRSFKIETPR
jgi:hypothetical protein